MATFNRIIKYVKNGHYFDAEELKKYIEICSKLDINSDIWEGI